MDCLYSWWEHQSPAERDAFSLLQIKADNGPESNGRRTQFLNRMVQFADHIGKPIQLLYYPPYHSKYNPVERCWGILEKHWNGAKLADAQTMLQWAKLIADAHELAFRCPFVVSGQNPTAARIQKIRIQKPPGTTPPGSPE